jgi:hypothetical protein
MPGLGGLEGGVDRLVVTHLADHDHVGVLTQGGPQRIGEGLRIRADLSLRDDALVVSEDELDGVLDRDDLGLPRAVDLVDHGGEGGRLAHPRRSSHEHVASSQCRDLSQHPGKVEVFEAPDLERDHPQHHVEEATLP